MHLQSVAPADRDWLARMSSDRLAQIVLLVEVKFLERKQNHRRNTASELEHNFCCILLAMAKPKANPGQ